MQQLARGPVRHPATNRPFFEWSVDDPNEAARPSQAADVAAPSSHRSTTMDDAREDRRAR